MKMLNTFKKTLTGLCLFGMAQLASAGMISLNPTPALGNVGDTISVDLMWTGSVGDYIGDFDVQVNFNAAIASSFSINVDPDCGLDSLCLGLYGSGTNASGLYAFVVSFDSPADLISNQDILGNTFRLATFEFLAEAEGQTALTLTQTTFGNENGEAISPTLQNGQICIGPNGCANNVPAPGTVTLLGLGLAGIGWFRRKRV